MGALLFISVLCCLGVLALGGSLWFSVRQRRGQALTSSYQLTGSLYAAMAAIPAPLFLHPRMDLASGRAPGNQAVDMDRRRSRLQELATLDVQLELPRTLQTQTFEPFVERRKRSRSCRQRLDLLYARDTMGDLSDPDIRRARRLQLDGLEAALAVK